MYAAKRPRTDDHECDEPKTTDDADQGDHCTDVPPAMHTHRTFPRIAALLVLLGGATLHAQATQRNAGGGRLDPAGFFDVRARADEARAARQLAQADSLYHILAANAPSDPSLWEALGSIQTALGKRTDAVRSWEAAWRTGSSPRGEVAYIVARLHAGLGHGPEAMDWIDSALVNRLEGRSRLRTDSVFAALRGQPRFDKQAGVMPAGVSRDAGWRHDIAYFVAEAQRLHVSLTRRAFSTMFLRAADSLLRDVPKLSNMGITLGLAHLARQLGDGHSYLIPQALPVPVQFYRFSDGLFIVNASSAHADLIATRVVRIGRVSADSALRAVAATMSSDNEMGVLWLGMNWLIVPVALYALGLSADSSHISLVVENSAGASRTVVLAPAAWAPPRSLRAPTSAAAAPLWLQRVSDKHWVTPLPTLRAVYAQYNEVRNDAKGTVAQFADSVTSMLAVTKATSLIVDVRHNNGGRRTLNTPLLLSMAGFRRASPDHRVFVITGRATFSAAQVFISQAEWMARPIYVGEPSSSRPNFVGEDTEVVLPYSGMRGSVSSQYHQGSTFQDERRFISPHLPVSLSSADYFANRDPAMQAPDQLLRRAQRRSP